MDQSALLDGGAVGYLILLQKSRIYEVRCWHQTFGNLRRWNCMLCWCILLFPPCLPFLWTTSLSFILTLKYQKPFETGCSLFFQLSVTLVKFKELISSMYVRYKSSLLAQVLLCWSLSFLFSPYFFFESNLWLPLHRVWKFLFIIILSKKYNCRGVPLPGWHWQFYMWLLTFQENHLIQAVCVWLNLASHGSSGKYVPPWNLF